MNHKILLVDDDEIYLNALKTECEFSGLQTLIARDGEEAVQKAVSEQPELIVLDIILPKHTGLTVLDMLRKDKKTESIPVIAVSNFYGDDNKKKVIEKGAVDFFGKDTHKISEIIDKIKKILD